MIALHCDRCNAAKSDIDAMKASERPRSVRAIMLQIAKNCKQLGNYVNLKFNVFVTYHGSESAWHMPCVTNTIEPTTHQDQHHQ